MNKKLQVAPLVEVAADNAPKRRSDKGVYFMKNGEDLRRLPRVPHVERLEIQYSIMDNDVHIEKLSL